MDDWDISVPWSRREMVLLRDVLDVDGKVLQEVREVPLWLLACAQRIGALTRQ